MQEAVDHYERVRQAWHMFSRIFKMPRLAAAMPVVGLLAWIGVVSAQSATTHRVAMRDGVKLATDVYLPVTGAGPWPAIVVRTPYDRTRFDQEYGRWAQAGYAIVIQDTRGRFASEGKAMAFQSDGWGEQQDGYDTLAWLVKQPFCNGKVGTVGASAMGIAQVLMAPTAPPGLVCQYLLVAPVSLYHEAMYQGGVWRKNQVEDWMRGNAHPDALKLALEHTEFDEFWRGFDAGPQAGKVNVPAVHYGGWFDTFCEGTINNFTTRQYQGGPGARGAQKLIMGPWTHGGGGAKNLGDFPIPATGRRAPVDVSAPKWFAHYLKGETNGIARAPAVQYYVMGPFDGSPSSGNRWKSASTWPVPSTNRAYYLHGDGQLGLQPPAQWKTLQFIHHPTNPVPTIGGRNLSLPAGPKDQRKIESRADVLVFTSDTLAEDLEVTGKVKARVRLSVWGVTNAHLAARLCDVYPDGRSILIAEGIQNISVPVRRAGIAGGQTVEVDLWSTSMVFARGHKIRLILSGSNYPRWDTYGQGGGPVTNLVALPPSQPSQLWLPVVTNGGE